ncbi:MAG: signal peptidase I, partial [Bacillota bacterium]
AFLLAVVIKSFVIDNRIIPTSSMYPTVPENSRILVNKFTYYFNDVDFQDIIVFEPTDETKGEAGIDDDMLKRTIGLPGDVIEIKSGTLYRNGEAVKEGYISDNMEYEYGPITVPEGYIFVLGDNRNLSFDSHAWSNPFVPLDNVKGKAFMIYWPKDNFGTID